MKIYLINKGSEESKTKKCFLLEDCNGNRYLITNCNLVESNRPSYRKYLGSFTILSSENIEIPFVVILYLPETEDQYCVGELQLNSK